MVIKHLLISTTVNPLRVQTPATFYRNSDFSIRTHTSHPSPAAEAFFGNSEPREVSESPGFTSINLQVVIQECLTQGLPKGNKVSEEAFWPTNSKRTILLSMYTLHLNFTKTHIIQIICSNHFCTNTLDLLKNTDHWPCTTHCFVIFTKKIYNNFLGCRMSRFFFSETGTPRFRFAQTNKNTTSGVSWMNLKTYTPGDSK